LPRSLSVSLLPANSMATVFPQVGAFFPPLSFFFGKFRFFQAVRSSRTFFPLSHSFGVALFFSFSLVLTLAVPTVFLTVPDVNWRLLEFFFPFAYSCEVFSPPPLPFFPPVRRSGLFPSLPFPFLWQRRRSAVREFPLIVTFSFFFFRLGRPKQKNCFLLFPHTIPLPDATGCSLWGTLPLFTFFLFPLSR